MGWIFKFCAIIDAAMVIIALFCLPETLYIRGTSSSTSANFTRKTYIARLRLVSHNPTLTLHPTTFLLSTLRLVLSPTALFPALYYSVNYGFASILPAVTAGVVFADHYQWTTLRIGLSYGGALTIGSLLGELFAGWVIDHLATRRAHNPPFAAPLSSSSSSSHPPPTSPPTKPSTRTVPSSPTSRLYPLLPANLLLALGLLLYGFTLQYHTTPALPLLGMALSCFALQILTTATYTFSIDSNAHTPNPGPNGPNKFPRAAAGAANVAQLFNVTRQEFGMTFAFYAVRLGEAIGYQWESVLFAGVGSVLAFAPVAWLVWRDRGARNRNGRREEEGAGGGGAGGAGVVGGGEANIAGLEGRREGMVEEGRERGQTP